MCSLTSDVITSDLNDLTASYPPNSSPGQKILLVNRQVQFCLPWKSELPFPASLWNHSNKSSFSHGHQNISLSRY